MQFLLWLDLDREAKVRNDTIVVTRAVLSWWAAVEDLCDIDVSKTMGGEKR